ncbi:MAG: hypothetical protein HZA53_12520 [Planctomycetes bacterium]|nr:hypothetical protein [Planctomycetota bacterium]
MHRSSFALTLLAACALPSVAQAQDWNRRISDVRIVHPPGTPPGTWRVTASVEGVVTDNVPVPSSLAFELHLLLNGVDIGVLPSGPLDNQNGPSCFYSSSCHVAQPCNGLFNGAGNIPGICFYGVTGVGPLPVCGCMTLIGDYDFGTYSSDLRTTDTLGVHLVAGPGSIPELDTSDDNLDLHVPDNVLGTVVCAGDGATTPTPCPCGNTGTSGHGCANSQNAGGALVVATGWTQADPLTGTDTAVLRGSLMPATSSAIYLKSDALNAAGSVFGDGVSCLTGSIIRLRTKINVGGASQFPEPGDPSLSVRGATPPGSGLTGNYAAYYRNAAGTFCPPATFNISNAVSIVW